MNSISRSDVYRIPHEDDGWTALNTSLMCPWVCRDRWIEFLCFNSPFLSLYTYVSMSKYCLLLTWKICLRSPNANKLISDAHSYVADVDDAFEWCYVCDYNSFLELSLEQIKEEKNYLKRKKTTWKWITLWSMIWIYTNRRYVRRRVYWHIQKKRNEMNWCRATRNSGNSIFGIVILYNRIAAYPMLTYSTYDFPHVCPAYINQ